MERDSEAENETLRGFARIHLSQFDSSEEDLSLEEEMENERNTPAASWVIPTREERDLILAEEIIRFASITDRPPTSKVIRIVQAIPDSTSTNYNPLPGTSGSNTSAGNNDIDNATEFFASEMDDREMLTASATTSRTMNIASEAGTSGSKPPQSASIGFSESLALGFEDAFFPVGGAKIPIDPQVDSMRPDTMPVTNHILAAIAQSELEGSPSSGSVILQPTSSAEITDYTPRYTHHQLFGYFLETLKNIQGSDFSRSSSPDSTAPACSVSPTSDELSVFKQHLLRATEIEEMMAREQRERDAAGRYPAANLQRASRWENYGINANAQGGIPEEEPFAEPVDNSHNQLFVVDPRQNNVQLFALNPNANNAVALNASNEAVPGQFHDEEDSPGPEWTRPEKRRLGTVIRDLSREMRTRELQHRKAKLLKKGRVIAQALEKKICDINREIMAVNKRSLRHVAFPLEQIQEYDWVKVATVLNGKRSPEDCRTYWKCFLHPAINAREWSVIEIKAMEVIAQRHNFRNWDEIAEELNTGRTGYQCFTYYRKKLCPHRELHGKNQQ